MQNSRKKQEMSFKSLKNDNRKFKILIIGTSGVGKSSLLLKYIKNTFCYDYQVTTGAEFYTKNVKLNQKNSVNLQIWDTMGQQIFRSVVRSLYKGVSAVLLVYSIDRKQSLSQLANWYHDIHQTAHKETMFWIVGTKLDLQDIRQVNHAQVQQFAKSIHAAGCIEVSAKTGENIKQLFDKLSKHLWKKYMSCQEFRNLVQPQFQDLNKSQSVNLVNYRLSVRQSKDSCCIK